MDHISGSLNKRLTQRSLSTTANAAYVCHKANELSQGRYQALSFREGVLMLAAPSSGAAQNLRFVTSELLESLNSALTAPTIQKIRIVVA